MQYIVFLYKLSFSHSSFCLSTKIKRQAQQTVSSYYFYHDSALHLRNFNYIFSHWENSCTSGQPCYDNVTVSVTGFAAISAIDSKLLYPPPEKYAIDSNCIRSLSAWCDCFPDKSCHRAHRPCRIRWVMACRQRISLFCLWSYDLVWMQPPYKSALL